MATEREYKFLAKSDDWRSGAIIVGVIKQLYLWRGRSECRIRLLDKLDNLHHGKHAFITYKKQAGKRKTSAKAHRGDNALNRREIEVQIPYIIGKIIVTLLQRHMPGIEKTRYHYNYQDLLLEIDSFPPIISKQALIEIETDRDLDGIKLPSFLGENISLNPDFQNQTMAKKAAF